MKPANERLQEYIEKSAAPKFRVGDQVEGLFEDYWHPGKIIDIIDNSYSVQYYYGADFERSDLQNRKWKDKLELKNGLWIEKVPFNSRKIRKIQGSLAGFKPGDAVLYRQSTEWWTDEGAHWKTAPAGLHEWNGEIDRIEGNVASIRSFDDVVFSQPHPTFRYGVWVSAHYIRHKPR
jgi:hypothetical protein